MVAKSFNDTKPFLNRWRDFYEDFTDEQFLASYAMIKMIDRLWDFYKIEDLEDAMAYYFNDGGRDIYNFLYDLDNVIRASMIDVETKQLFEKLSKNTTEQLETIMKSEPGSNN